VRKAQADVQQEEDATVLSADSLLSLKELSRWEVK
jgi:hypothetical protein